MIYIKIDISSTDAERVKKLEFGKCRGFSERKNLTFQYCTSSSLNCRRSPLICEKIEAINKAVLFIYVCENSRIGRGGGQAFWKISTDAIWGGGGGYRIEHVPYMSPKGKRQKAVKKAKKGVRKLRKYW